MFRHKILIYSIVTIFVGFFLVETLLSKKAEPTSSNPIPTPALTQQQMYDRVNGDKAETPECNFGRCPEYLDGAWNIFDEGPGTSVVEVPTAMTKGAGEVWVIHLGKVVY